MEHLHSIIYDHLDDENFSVFELSKLLHYSRTQAYRKVKLTTGYSPSAYITELRLLRACVLLINTQPLATIAQVAYSVGFRDPAYFSRAFKRRFGVTPKLLREKWENEDLHFFETWVPFLWHFFFTILIKKNILHIKTKLKW